MIHQLILTLKLPATVLYFALVLLFRYYVSHSIYDLSLITYLLFLFFRHFFTAKYNVTLDAVFTLYVFLSLYCIPVIGSLVPFMIIVLAHAAYVVRYVFLFCYYLGGLRSIGALSIYIRVELLYDRVAYKVRKGFQRTVLYVDVVDCAFF